MLGVIKNLSHPPNGQIFSPTNVTTIKLHDDVHQNDYLGAGVLLLYTKIHYTI
jgi:hypothetical protein